MSKKLRIITPLIWPEDKPVTDKKIPSSFRSCDIPKDLVTIYSILSNSKHIDKAVLSTNLQFSAAGSIIGRQPGQYNPGASLILDIRGNRFILACDKYDLTRDNLHAIVISLRHYHHIWRNGLKLESIEIVNNHNS
jgi:hypothetical protein